MGKFETRFLKSFNAILTCLIALLGFSTSCETKAEYGTPNAKFIVNGTVQSSVTNSAIKNIRVIMLNDTALTDNSGNFTVMDKWGFPVSQVYDLKFQDIDSIENGRFINLDTIVKFIDPQFVKGDGHWYVGETSTEISVRLNVMPEE